MKLKINLRTKSGYRKTVINELSLIYYAKTQKGYRKKSESQIKKIHEKIIEQKAKIRYKKKIIEIREYQKKKIIEKRKGRGKDKVKRKQREKREVEYKETHRHETDTYSFICKVSDRILPAHLVAFRTEAEEIFGSVEAVHNNYYPDHIVISYEFVNTFSIEDKGISYNNQITEKQKDFLKKIGFSKSEISLIPDKKTASKILSRRKR